MLDAEPCFHAASQAPRELSHLLCFLVRNRVGSFVITDVPLLAETVELRDLSRVRPHGVSQRLNDPIVIGIALGPVSARGQRRNGELQRGVVGDV